MENPDKKSKKGGKRLDSTLEAVGAEFLVLGHLLIEGIQAYKSYVNYPGYDITATNPEKDRSCRIQVKSRWATDYDGGFPIRNFDCDFVVFAKLNRGYRYKKQAQNPHPGRKEPQLFVFPEWIQHPITGNWWCDYYGSEYWCYAQNVGTGEWGSLRATPGWQYSPAIGG